MACIPPGFYAIASDRLPRIDIDATSPANTLFNAAVHDAAKETVGIVVVMGRRMVGAFSRYQAIGIGDSGTPVTLDVATFAQPLFPDSTTTIPSQINTISVATMEHVPVPVQVDGRLYRAQVVERRVSSMQGSAIQLGDYAIPNAAPMESTRFLDDRLTSAQGVGFGVLHGLRLYVPGFTPVSTRRPAPLEVQVTADTIGQLPPPNPAIMSDMLLNWARWQEPVQTPGRIDWLTVSGAATE